MLYLKIRSTLTIFLAVLLIYSCKDKDISPADETGTSATTTSVNQWIYEVMNDAYFWYKTMPAAATLDKTIDPEAYFEKLVYQRSTTDRFSMVTDDVDALQAEFNGVSKIFGIGYSLSYLDDSKTNMGLFLNLVVKGSPAEAQGLKRGDIVVKINNTSITATNYQTLFGSGETASFTMGTLSNGKITATSTVISVTKAEVSEDPVVFSTVISKPDYGKTIGYLVYTQFVPGTALDENKYDNELRQVFADFKSQGVNELVLDLRFNSGGYISSAETLASLVGKGISSSKIFYKEKWNDKYTSYWQKMNGANALNYNFLNETNNIGSNLSRVFVLTSTGTASASELVINCLKPYMDVVTIGEHTAGKNLFGSLISDEEKRWKWGVYMMLGQTSNANDQSDYGTVNGMTPTYLVEDSSVPYKAFGDESETLLRKALDVMGIPASNGGRLAPSLTVERLLKESLRDNLHPGEKRMIKNIGINP
ncbi:S41 family peptidase [Dyadobacter sp. 32]|uniref:S41 family peptidase n=1 Tax=Dyadobacter sp. 32 TaxID=538966 RepID=UPI0039C6D0E9